MAIDAKPFPSHIAHLLAIALIAACGLYIFRWSFWPEVTFFNDDWHWILRAVFTRWRDMLSIWTFLPAAAFGDRPVEEAGIRLFHQFFELEHWKYAAAMLAIHIANAVLLYLLVTRLIESRFYGMLAGVLFVIDHSVAYPAWWVSTLADSASLFFCLCAFLAYIGGGRYSAVAAVLFYYLAVK